MKTEKLQALLATASDEDKVAIEAVLNKRAAASTPVENTAEATVEATAEAPAEAHKLTDEELHALAEECRANLHHKCQAVPFNTAEWVDGVIIGVVEEKRARKVLYSIKADDGRKLVKVYDSKLLKVFDEVAEITRAPRSKGEAIRLNDEEVAALVEASSVNIGKVLTFDTDNGTITTRIMAIQVDKRNNTVMYKLKGIEAEGMTEETIGKTYYKVIKTGVYTIAEDFDEEGRALNEKYTNRKANSQARQALTPQERVLKCEENLQKAEERLAKLQQEIEAKKEQLAAARKELEESLSEQTAEETTEELA